MGVLKEIEELRETLAHAEMLHQRRREIEDELNKVWTISGSPVEESRRRAGSAFL